MGKKKNTPNPATIQELKDKFTTTTTETVEIQPNTQKSAQNQKNSENQKDQNQKGQKDQNEKDQTQRRTQEGTSDRSSGRTYRVDMCPQCDLLDIIVERALDTFEHNNPNLHLVLKELRYCAMEIGSCCGRPEGSSYDSSRSTRVFWDNLEEQVEKEKNRNIPFKAPKYTKAPPHKKEKTEEEE